VLSKHIIITANPASPAVNVKEVNDIKKTDWTSDGDTSFLFHLMTLYSSQTYIWQKYEEEWALFEHDHLKNRAPIPHNA